MLKIAAIVTTILFLCSLYFFFTNRTADAAFFIGMAIYVNQLGQNNNIIVLIDKTLKPYIGNAAVDKLLNQSNEGDK